MVPLPVPTLNAQAYDQTAAEYERRIGSDLLNDAPILHRVWGALGPTVGSTPRVIDVGCGAGVNLAMFSDLGAEVVGIDISGEMVRVASKTAPSARVIHGDVMTSSTAVESYDLVFAKAFVHLFPLSEFASIMNRLRGLIAPSGRLYLATTVHSYSYEGFYPKEDYAESPLRFRRYWNAQDLLNALSEHNFLVEDKWTNIDPRNGKKWINLVLATGNRP